MRGKQFHFGVEVSIWAIIIFTSVKQCPEEKLRYTEFYWDLLKFTKPAGHTLFILWFLFVGILFFSYARYLKMLVCRSEETHNLYDIFRTDLVRSMVSYIFL